ncbi:MAG TPA: hypothetical protein DEA91_20765 [Paenibacillus sp.]|nr:hypothetical protein [Paenibacillus sp.]
MADYDYYNIEPQLQELDPNILRIDFDYRTEKHRIMCWDPYLKEEYIAMTVPWKDLDSRVVTHMRRINPTKFNAFDELEQNMILREIEQEKKIEEMAHSMADMLYKPLLKDAYC